MKLDNKWSGDCTTFYTHNWDTLMSQFNSVRKSNGHNFPRRASVDPQWKITHHFVTLMKKRRQKKSVGMGD